jgi:hypothetical protein
VLINHLKPLIQTLFHCFAILSPDGAASLARSAPLTTYQVRYFANSIILSRKLKRLLLVEGYYFACLIDQSQILSIKLDLL